MEPIERCVERWHDFIASRDPEALSAVLADDVTFLSPVVFTAQEGKAITTFYLTAAVGLLGAEGTGFRYRRQILSGHDATLEFETTLDGKYVNGVDLIHCDDEGLITEFKVMVRPLQAINALHTAMAAQLGARRDSLS